MARKTEKGGKFRNVHCRTWNMARKLKIMENEKHPRDHLKNDEITEKREKWEMHTVGPGIWREKWKSRKMRNTYFSTWNMARKTEKVVVLVRVSIPAQTSWPRSKLGRKGFIWLTLPYYCSSPRKSGLELKQVRKQELMQRPLRDVLYWLASPGLLSLLSYRTQDYQPRDGPTHKGPFPLDH